MVAAVVLAVLGVMVLVARLVAQPIRLVFQVLLIWVEVPLIVM